MKQLLLTFVIFLLSFQSYSFDQTEKSDIILKEYIQLRSKVSQLNPDYKIGDFSNVKRYNNHILLWSLEDDLKYHEVIRIYRDKGKYKGFAIAYHRSASIIDGRVVIRRFIGQEPFGWRNDTIDLDSAEYLGYQGLRKPVLDSIDQEITKEWGITLFSN